MLYLRISLCYLILLFSCYALSSHIDYVDFYEKREKHFFLLQNFATFKGDILDINPSNEYKIILIVSESRSKSLPQGHEKVFLDNDILKEFNFEKVCDSIKKFILKYEIKNFDLISHDEYSLSILGKVRDEFHIVNYGFDIIDNFLTKPVMKQKLNNKIRTPKYLKFNPEEYYQDKNSYIKFIYNELNLPIFAKPTNDAGAHNTSKINTLDQLVLWIDNYSHKSSFELDEFINGDLYHCDSLIQKGKIKFFQACKYSCPAFEFLKHKPHGSLPLLRNDPNFAILEEFNNKVLSAMQPVPDGATHHEVFIKENGELIFLEIAARTPGAMICQTYQKYHGFNMEAAHFHLQMGVEPKICSTIDNPLYSAWVWFPIKKGKVISLNKPNISSFYDLSWKININDVLENPEELKDAAATIIMWNENYEKLKNDFIYLTNSFNLYDIE